MNQPTTRIVCLPAKAGQRLLVTSDIHGHPDHLHGVRISAVMIC